MILTVRTPFLKSPVHSSETIVAKHDAERKLTIINTDCDVVTMGLTAAVLANEFQRALEHFDPAMQEEIKQCIEEAMKGA